MRYREIGIAQADRLIARDDIVGLAAVFFDLSLGVGLNDQEIFQVDQRGRVYRQGALVRLSDVEPSGVFEGADEDFRPVERAAGGEEHAVGPKGVFGGGFALIFHAPEHLEGIALIHLQRPDDFGHGQIGRAEDNGQAGNPHVVAFDERFIDLAEPVGMEDHEIGSRREAGGVRIDDGVVGGQRVERIRMLKISQKHVGRVEPGVG